MHSHWLALRYDSRRFDFLRTHLEYLEVEMYAPVRFVLKKRTDRPGFLKVEELLFSGYMFVRFDWDVVHTSAITELNGAYGFVSFGGRPPLAIRQADIDDIKSAVKAYNAAVEGKGAVVIGGGTSGQPFRIIVQQDSEVARNGALYRLFQQTDQQRTSPVEGVRQRRRPDRLVIAY